MLEAANFTAIARKIDHRYTAFTGHIWTQTKSIPGTSVPDWLEKLDGRTRIAGVMRERYRAFTDCLGGADRLDYVQQSLVSHVLWVEHSLAQQEQSLARGDAVDMDSYSQAVNAYQGLLAKLGINGQPGHLKRLIAVTEQQVSA